MRLALAFVLGVTAFAQRYTARESVENGVRYLVLSDTKAGTEIAISPENGGELSSLRVRFQGKPVELIYRARDYRSTSGWTGKAPLLWPATGRNFAKGVTPDPTATEFTYDWNGKRYKIPLHGFIRSMPWAVDKVAAAPNQAAAVLSVRDTPQTRSSYPFGFRLQVQYTLAESGLAIAYSVTSDSGNAEPMFFSIGNHITFRTPFLASGSAADMTFESPSTVEYLKDASTAPSGKEKPRSFAKPAKLGDLPALGVISLGGYSGDPYAVLRDPAGLAIRLTHHADSTPQGQVVQFNIWGDARNGYFSPEPWVGMQNSFNLPKGLVTLPAGKAWNWKLRIAVE